MSFRQAILFWQELDRPFLGWMWRMLKKSNWSCPVHSSIGGSFDNLWPALHATSNTISTDLNTLPQLNIICLQASYLYCLVLEYVPNKSLNDYLKTLPGCKLSEVGSWPMVRQLTSALVYLHHHNIVHRSGSCLLNSPTYKLTLTCYNLEKCCGKVYVF